MSASVGDIIRYIAGNKIAGKIMSIEYDSTGTKAYILDRLISNKTRHAYVLASNEGIVWKICSKRQIHEYEQMNGLVGVVIHPGYGGFSIEDDNGDFYKDTNRHDLTLINKVLDHTNPEVYDNYKIVYIPSCMVDYYSIHEYDGSEEVVLLYDKYKLAAIAKIRKSGKHVSVQMDEIDSILAMECNML